MQQATHHSVFNVDVALTDIFQRSSRFSNGTIDPPAVPNDDAACEPSRVLRDDRDSMFGALLADHFFGALFGGFMPAAFQGTDASQAVDLADEFWMDRRKPPAPRVCAPAPSFF